MNAYLVVLRVLRDRILRWDVFGDILRLIKRERAVRGRDGGYRLLDHIFDMVLRRTVMRFRGWVVPCWHRGIMTASVESFLGYIHMLLPHVEMRGAPSPRLEMRRHHLLKSAFTSKKRTIRLLFNKKGGPILAWKRGFPVRRVMEATPWCAQGGT